ncbi:MAG: hypothetical protein AAGJ35_15360, partial [Myxococcota bacterium]
PQFTYPSVYLRQAHVNLSWTHRSSRIHPSERITLQAVSGRLSIFLVFMAELLSSMEQSPAR